MTIPLRTAALLTRLSAKLSRKPQDEVRLNAPTSAEKPVEDAPDALTSLSAVDARPLPLDALHARADKLTQAVRPKQDRVARLDRARVDDAVHDRPDERHAEHVRNRVLKGRVDLVLDRPSWTAVLSR